MRRSLIIAALCFFTLCTAAQAVPYSVSSPSGGGAPGGNGGGGGGVLVNDLTHYTNSRDLTWDKSWHNDFFNRYFSKCIDQGKACYSSGPARRDVTKGDSGNYTNPAGGTTLNGKAWDQVYINNKCPLRANSNYRNANAAGGDCVVNSANIGRSGYPGWYELHIDAPFTSTQPVQGNPVAAIVRVWRECRGTLSADDAKAQKNQITGYVTAGSDGANADVKSGDDKCETTPIFERVAPANDGAAKNPNQWFYSKWTGGTYQPGSDNDTSKSSLLDKSARSAGTYYRSCDPKNYSAIARKHGCGQGDDALAGAGRYTSESSGAFQRSCENGGLGSNVVWSDNEIYGNMNYMQQSGDTAARKKWYQTNAEKLGQWLKDPTPTKWPIGITSNENKQYMCNELNEWISIDWSLPGASTQSSSSVKVKLNGIPGRVYAVQVAYLDRTENILTQSVQLMSSGAIPTDGDETRRNCKTDPSIIDPVRCPTTDQTCKTDRSIKDLANCPRVPGKETADAPPVRGPVNPSCDQAALTNDPATCDLVTDKVVADTPVDEDITTSGDGEGDKDYASLSAWFPRAFGGEIYNRDDAAATDAVGALDANHPDRKFKNGGTGWDYRDLADGTLGALSFSPNGLRGQGSLLTDTATGSMISGFSSSVTRATEVPARDAGLDRSTNAHINERYRTEDVRYTELIGENRRPLEGWDPTKGSVGRDTRRLTAEACATGAPSWTPFNSDGSPNWNGRQSCNDGDGLNDGDLGFGWRVKDAYYLPPTEGGTPKLRDLAVNFSQESNGDCKADYDAAASDNCARLALDDHGTDLKNRAYAIDIYSSRSYFSGGTPLYHVGSAPTADGNIRFCPPTKKIRVKIAEATTTTGPDWNDLSVDKTVDHWQNGGAGGGDAGWEFNAPNGQGGTGNKYVPYSPSTDDFYDDAKWGGTATIAADEDYLRRKSDGKLFIKHHAENRASFVRSNYEDDVVWGRSWWKHYRWNGTAWEVAGNDGGSYRIQIPKIKTITTPAQYEDRIVANESCVGGPATQDPASVNNINMSSQAYDADNNPVTKLPAGQYVIVYKVMLNDFAGGHWGILGDLSWRSNMNWVDGFSYDRSRFFLPVYESRPIG